VTVADIDYQWFRGELELAQRDLKLAAKRYGAVSNQRGAVWTADRGVLADAFVELEEAARAWVYAEQLFAIAARDLASSQGAPK
jgi:hypothetical protein